MSQGFSALDRISTVTNKQPSIPLRGVFPLYFSFSFLLILVLLFDKWVVCLGQDSAALSGERAS